MILLLCSAAAFAAPALDQGVLVGFKAGVPVTPYYDTGITQTVVGSTESTAATRRYVVGATAEWRLTQHFGFEFDTMFKRTGYIVKRTTLGNEVTRSAIDTKGDSWEFPLLAKYRFGRVLRPYIAAGGVLRYIGPIHGRGEISVENPATGTITRTPIETSDPGEVRKRLYPGLAAAVGLEIGSGRPRLLPELRYTRWTANFSVAENRLRFEPNQAELLLGVLF